MAQKWVSVKDVHYLYKKWDKMSNLPIGAEYDECAPYNVKETTFQFELTAKGIVWHEYCGTLDTEAAIDAIKSKLEIVLEQYGDVDVSDIDVSVY